MRHVVPVIVIGLAIGCGHKDPSVVEAAGSRCVAPWVARTSGRCCVGAVGACMREPPVARRVLVPGRQFDFGAADWEARGEVPPRHVATRAYELDAYELTEPGDDPARAASGLDRDEARAACAARGGRLPTDDEWLAAAALHRYPWGDTGLVCRRAAWGLEHGPCARGATTPDTVGAHPDGQSADGVFDLTGNVAEWVETASGEGLVRGGSFADDFAGSLRSWSSRVVSPTVRDVHVGARCAYDVAPKE